MTDSTPDSRPIEALVEEAEQWLKTEGKFGAFGGAALVSRLAERLRAVGEERAADTGAQNANE
jgi:hypothetical protein